MSVGYMAAILRNASHKVSVISPFARGVGSFKRVTRPHVAGQYEAILRHYTATTNQTWIRRVRGQIANYRSPTRLESQKPTIEAVRQVLTQDVDVLLISAYSMYRNVCQAICADAQAKGIPVVAGGPMFSVPEIAEAWLAVSGISGVFAGEPDGDLPEIIEAVLSGRDGHIAGLYISSPRGMRPPLTDLDSVPFPDYSDFPWERYPNKIVPMMTGRGCGWGVCTFCSDVYTTSGRSFRSRSPGNVLDEMTHQAATHETKIFTFLDLKLNSDLDVWRCLISDAQKAVPDCEWTASLHVNVTGENGLSLDELMRARSAGLSRITTGLESGSQRILNSMAKGTNPKALSQFVRHAWKAGISVRMT